MLLFKPHLAACFEQYYQDAREDAAVRDGGPEAFETGLDIDQFPHLCPFSLEDWLNQDFYTELRWVRYLNVENVYRSKRKKHSSFSKN